MKTFDDWFLAQGEYGSYGIRAEYFFEDVGYDHHNPQLMAEWLRAAYEAGIVAGQRDMRERAALVCFVAGAHDCADAIHALPIEGEKE